MSRPIARLRGLGPVMQRQLAEIDVHDEADLRALGAVEAYARLKFRFGRPISILALWAMDAALVERDWRQVTPARKAELKSALAARLPPLTSPD